VKKIFNLLLGVVTSIGGFVEAGSISTAAQGGAEFGFALLWAIAVATIILALLAEMVGRAATVGKRSMAAAVRERFGFHYQMAPLGAELIIDVLLLAAEIGGVAVAVKLLTAVGFQWWILPVGLLVWLVIWFGNFTVIEDGMGLLGMVTVTFVIAAWQLNPDHKAVVQGFIPSVPDHDLYRWRVDAGGAAFLAPLDCSSDLVGNRRIRNVSAGGARRRGATDCRHGTGDFFAAKNHT